MFKKKQDEKKQECLKCKYQELLKIGKAIFDKWDQKSDTPEELVVIQKQLIKLKKLIKKQKIDNELEFCAQHPEIFEFLPNEWT